MALQKNIVALSVWLLVFVGGQTRAADMVVVYTAPETPYNFLNSEGKIDGVLTRLVQRVMEVSDLNYEIRLLPWNRARQNALTQKNSLLFGMARIASREKDYYWLVPLMPRVPVLYGRQDDQRKVSRKDIKAGKYKSACYTNTVPCKILLRAGFPRETLSMYTYIDYDSRHRLLKSRRIDVVLEDPLTEYYYNKLEHGHSVEVAIKPMLVLEDLSVTMYMVAGKQTDVSIRKAVTDAYKQLNLNGKQFPITMEEGMKLIEDMVSK